MTDPPQPPPTTNRQKETQFRANEELPPLQNVQSPVDDSSEERESSSGSLTSLSQSDDDATLEKTPVISEAPGRTTVPDEQDNPPSPCILVDGVPILSSYSSSVTGNESSCTPSSSGATSEEEGARSKAGDHKDRAFSSSSDRKVPGRKCLSRTSRVHQGFTPSTSSPRQEKPPQSNDLPSAQRNADLPKLYGAEKRHRSESLNANTAPPEVTSVLQERRDRDHDSESQGTHAQGASNASGRYGAKLLSSASLTSSSLSADCPPTDPAPLARSQSKSASTLSGSNLQDASNLEGKHKKTKSQSSSNKKDDRQTRIEAFKRFLDHLNCLTDDDDSSGSSASNNARDILGSFVRASKTHQRRRARGIDHHEEDEKAAAALKLVQEIRETRQALQSRPRLQAATDPGIYRTTELQHAPHVYSKPHHYDVTRPISQVMPPVVPASYHGTAEYASGLLGARPEARPVRQSGPSNSAASPVHQNQRAYPTSFYGPPRASTLRTDLPAGNVAAPMGSRMIQSQALHPVGPPGAEGRPVSFPGNNRTIPPSYRSDRSLLPQSNVLPHARSPMAPSPLRSEMVPTALRNGVARAPLRSVMASTPPKREMSPISPKGRIPSLPSKSGMPPTPPRYGMSSTPPESGMPLNAARSVMDPLPSKSDTPPPISFMTTKTPAPIDSRYVSFLRGADNKNLDATDQHSLPRQKAAPGISSFSPERPLQTVQMFTQPQNLSGFPRPQYRPGGPQPAAPRSMRFPIAPRTESPITVQGSYPRRPVPLQHVQDGRISPTPHLSTAEPRVDYRRDLAGHGAHYDATASRIPTDGLGAERDHQARKASSSRNASPSPILRQPTGSQRSRSSSATRTEVAWPGQPSLYQQSSSPRDHCPTERPIQGALVDRHRTPPPPSPATLLRHELNMSQHPQHPKGPSSRQHSPTRFAVSPDRRASAAPVPQSPQLPSRFVAALNAQRCIRGPEPNHPQYPQASLPPDLTPRTRHYNPATIPAASFAYSGNPNIPKEHIRHPSTNPQTSALPLAPTTGQYSHLPKHHPASSFLPGPSRVCLQQQAHGPEVLPPVPYKAPIYGNSVPPAPYRAQKPIRQHEVAPSSQYSSREASPQPTQTPLTRPTFSNIPPAGPMWTPNHPPLSSTRPMVKSQFITRQEPLSKR